MLSFEAILIIAFIVAFSVGMALNRFFANRPLRFLVKKANKSAQRWSSQSKTISGGIGFYAIFIFSIVAYLIIFGVERISNPQITALLLVGSISFFMGLADDVMNSPPFFKFILQLLCAIILILFDIYIHISPLEWLNYTITILWVIGIMNSINMLDNMDSITTLVSISIIGGVIFSQGMNTAMDAEFFVFFAVCFIAVLCSFLFFNWNPSKMYMGDNGSQLLGAILAVFGIIFFWNALPLEVSSYGYNSKQFIIVAVAFIVPISDTTSVTINRLMRGQAPFVGGRDHTTHHLSYLGLTDRGVAYTLFLISSVSVGLSFYIAYNTPNWNSLHFWLFFAYALIIFASLYSITKFAKPKNL